MCNMTNFNNYLDVIFPWLESKRNVYHFNPNQDFIENKFSIIANELPFNSIEVDKFYLIHKTFANQYKYEVCKGKSVFLKLKAEHDQMYIVKEFYSALCTKDKDLILRHIISLKANQLLQNELISIDTAMLRKLIVTEEDIANIDIDQMRVNDTAFEDMVQHFLQKYKRINLDKKFIYIPACYKSIFSSKNYMYEIKKHKYLYSTIKDKCILHGYSKYENIHINQDLMNHDHSIAYDHSVAYYDFINTSSEFQDYILNIANTFVVENQQNFLFWILDAINYYFFDVVFLQQNYVLNRYLLTASKKRPKMTVKDVLISILQRIEEHETDQLYILGTNISIGMVIHLIDWIESNSITLDSNRDIRDQLKHLHYPHVNQDLPLIDLLYRLFWKVPLKESVNELVSVINSIHEQYSVKLEHGKKRELRQLFSDIFDASVDRTTGDRKYLNKLYMKDLKSLIKTDNLYITRELKSFNMLQPKILVGLDNEIKSFFLKKG